MVGPSSRKDNEPLFQLPPPGQRGNNRDGGQGEERGKETTTGSGKRTAAAGRSVKPGSRVSKHRSRAGGENPFGHIVEGPKGNLLGMSSKAQRTFFFMVLACSVFVVIVLFNAPGAWFGATQSMDEYRQAEREQQRTEQQEALEEMQRRALEEFREQHAEASEGNGATNNDEAQISNGGNHNNGNGPAAAPGVDEAAQDLARQLAASLGEQVEEARLILFAPVDGNGRVPEGSEELLAELEMELATELAGRARLIPASRVGAALAKMGFEPLDVAEEEVRRRVAERLEATHKIAGQLTPWRDDAYRLRLLIHDLADGTILGGARSEVRLEETAEQPEPSEPETHAADDEAEPEPQTQPGPEEPVEVEEEPEGYAERPEEPDHQERIRFEEISEHFERPLRIPSAIGTQIGNTNDDVYHRDHAEWHAHLLREVPQLDPKQVQSQSVEMFGTSPDWFAAAPHQEGLREAIGHAFTVEGTVWRAREVRTSELGLEEQPLVDGEPASLVWRGLVVFRFTRFLHERPFQRPDYAGVIFTATDVPEWLRQYRVLDETQKPVRVRLTGVLMHLRPDEEHESGLITDEISTDRPRRAPVYPQLVASSIERLPPFDPEIDRELLQTVDDGVSRGRRMPPKVAQQHLLYRLKHLDEDSLQREFYDRAIDLPAEETTEHGRLGYHDLLEQSPTYRQMPVIARMRGQVAQIGEDVRNPVLPYRLRPNPYGIRKQWIGALTLLDERGAQQNALYDALRIKLWDEHAGEYYLYEGPDAKRPSGGAQPASPLRRGDEIEVTGYYLWVYRYLAKTDEWREVPRFVVHEVRQLPPRSSPTDTLTTVFLIFMGGALVMIFVLFRRESRSAASYRSSVAKRQLERGGKLKPRSDSIAAHRAKEKLAQANADNVPADEGGTSSPESERPPGEGAGMTATEPSEESPAASGEAPAQESDDVRTSGEPPPPEVPTKPGDAPETGPDKP